VEQECCKRIQTAIDIFAMCFSLRYGM